MTTEQRSALLEIFPITATIANDQLAIGGVPVPELVREYGTPLYIFDEATIRHQTRGYRGAFERRYPNTLVVYACKAFVNGALARVVASEGLGADVVSGGEIGILARADFPLDKAYFHGNNKSAEELQLALLHRVGQIVVDNLYEIDLAERVAAAQGGRFDVLLRISPGVDPHTHEKTTTGIIDSKFGLPIITGDANRAVERVLASPHLDLVGLHCHLGSPIFELEPYTLGIETVIAYAAELRREHGVELKQFSPGGGFAVQYVQASPAPSIDEYAETITSTLIRECDRHGLPQPRLVIEPGRSIVGRAGVAVYSVGASKEVPGVRKYVSVDGGMADNIRPAIYGSLYEAAVANRMSAPPEEVVTIAGKYCESGDLLIRDVELPRLLPGDLIAMPAAGAYCLAMASNYNAALHPPIVLVNDSQARLIRRRQTVDDLMALDV